MWCDFRCGSDDRHPLFDHLIGGYEQRLQNAQTKRSRRGMMAGDGTAGQSLPPLGVPQAVSRLREPTRVSPRSRRKLPIDRPTLTSLDGFPPLPCARQRPVRGRYMIVMPIHLG
jgi:hypothetical protein